MGILEELSAIDIVGKPEKLTNPDTVATVESVGYTEKVICVEGVATCVSLAISEPLATLDVSDSLVIEAN